MISCAKNSAEEVTAGLVKETAVAMLATTSDELQKRKLSQNLAANHYIIFAGILVFSMQLGFALLGGRHGPRT